MSRNKKPWQLLLGISLISTLLAGCGGEELADLDPRAAQTQPGKYLAITADARTGQPTKKCFAIETPSTRPTDSLIAQQDQGKPEVDQRCKFYKSKVICKIYSVCKNDLVKVIPNTSTVLVEPYHKVQFMVFSDCGEPFSAEGWLYKWDYAMTEQDQGAAITHRRYGMVLPFVRTDDPQLEGAVGGKAWKGLRQSNESLPLWFVELPAGNMVKISKGHALRGYSCQNIRSKASSASPLQDCLKEGHDLEVLRRAPAEGGCWYKVRYSTKQGSQTVVKEGHVLQAVVYKGSDAWENSPRHLLREKQLYYFAPPPPTVALPSCLTNADCPLDEIGHGQFCRKPDGQCGGTGICAPLPWDCSPIPEGPTVVGCNGKCYADPCYAFIQGVNVKSAQACSP